MEQLGYNSPVTDFLNFAREEISQEDSGMDLEPPKDEYTVEHPPNGGIRAWLIVLSCTCINALVNGGMVVILLCLEPWANETGIYLSFEEQMEMVSKYLACIQIYGGLALVVMVIFGYRVTVVIGACLYMVAFISFSYMEDDVGLFKLLIYGPLAIGISFIRFGGLLPVLEYFTTKRMTALFLSRLGTYIGEAAPFIIEIVLPDIITAKWRVTLRYTAGICIGIGLLGMTLKEIKLTVRDNESVTFVQRNFGVFKKGILKNVLFWFICTVYFFYQWGIETPKDLLMSSDRRLDIVDKPYKSLTYNLSPIAGSALGMFVAWLFNKMAIKEKSRLYIKNLEDKRLHIIFGVLAVSTFLSSVACFIAPSVLNFVYFTTFRLLFSTFNAFCEGIRDNSVPEIFGRKNIRIVEGFIIMSSGVGGIINGEIEGLMDDWSKIFRYGGGMLLVSSVVTIAVFVADKNKALDVIHAKIPGNSDVPLRPFNNQRIKNRKNSEEHGATSGVHNKGFE